MKTGIKTIAEAIEIIKELQALCKKKDRLIVKLKAEKKIPYNPFGDIFK